MLGLTKRNVRSTGHLLTKPQNRQLAHQQITTAASSAHIGFILKEKMKFSLQRSHQIVRSPTCPKFDTLLRMTPREFPKPLLSPLQNVFALIIIIVVILQPFRFKVKCLNFCNLNGLLFCIEHSTFLRYCKKKIKMVIPRRKRNSGLPCLFSFPCTL